jgi:photosystem II stability/assembly factor-like uncharacterized protein
MMTMEVLKANDTNLGQVFAFAASSRDYFAATTSGLYCSQDKGCTWHNLYAALEQSLPSTIVAVSQDGRTIIAGVEGGLVCSNDAGLSWKRVPFPPPTPHFTTLANHDHYFIAGTADDGVFISEDNGLTWLPWNFGLLDERILSVALSGNFATNHHVFLGTESGLYLSRNRGKSWLELPVVGEPVLSLATLNDLVIAGTENQGAFLSRDGGTTWQVLGLENLTSTKTVNALHVSSDGIRLLVPEGVVHSSDDGKSWSFELSSEQVGVAFLVTEINVLVALAEGGISPHAAESFR